MGTYGLIGEEPFNAAPLCFWRSQIIQIVIKFILQPHRYPSFRTESMRRFSLYAAVILCVCRLSASQAAERFGQWSLEQPDDFIFALSFKRSTLSDDRTAASQLAFICNQDKKDVAVLLI